MMEQSDSNFLFMTDEQIAEHKRKQADMHDRLMAAIPKQKSDKEQIEELRAELAKEREKVKELEVKRDVAVATIELLKVRCDVRGRALAGQAAETKQLREQLEQLEQQAETRKLALDAAVSSSCVLGAELAAALAVIEQMLACFEAAEVEGLAEALNNTTDERLKDLIYRRLMYVPTIPTNLDALHEARAQECERLAELSEQGMLLCGELIKEAAAHRARKQATKEK